MKTSRFLVAIAGVSVGIASSSWASAQSPSPDLPLQWIENRGQWPDTILHAACGGGIEAMLDARGFTVVVPGEKPAHLALRWPTAARAIIEEEQGPTSFSLFLDADADHWASAIRGSSALRCRVLPGIDVLLRAGDQQQGLRYDVDVAPGADLEAMLFCVEGATAIELGRDGELVMRGTFGEVVQTAPIAWQQEIDGSHTAVGSAFEIVGATSYRFAVPERDVSKRLVIDPTVQVAPLYATYFYDPSDLLVDSQGRILLCGDKSGEPAASWVTARHGQNTTAPTQIAYIARIDTASSVPDALTLVGGAWFMKLALDPGNGTVLATGAIWNTDYPITDGSGSLIAGNRMRAPLFALDAATMSQMQFSVALPETDWAPALAIGSGSRVYVAGHADSQGGVLMPLGSLGGADGFLIEIDGATGVPTRGHRIGGSGADSCDSVAVSGGGTIYVAGHTSQVTGTSAALLLPTSPQALRASPTAPPSGHGKNRTTSDADVFLMRFEPSALALEYSTLVGGDGTERGASHSGSCLTVSGTRVALYGRSSSTNFTPAMTVDSTVNREDGFVCLLDFAGFGANQPPQVVLGTFVGGRDNDSVNDVAFDSLGRLHVTGRSRRVSGGNNNSDPFPVVDNSTGLLVDGAIRDTAFYQILDPIEPPATALIYSSAVGGPEASYARRIALGPTENPHFLLGAGDGLPTTAGALFASKVGSIDAWVGIYPSRL